MRISIYILISGLGVLVPFEFKDNVTVSMGILEKLMTYSALKLHGYFESIFNPDNHLMTNE